MEVFTLVVIMIAFINSMNKLLLANSVYTFNRHEMLNCMSMSEYSDSISAYKLQAIFYWQYPSMLLIDMVINTACS